MPNKTKQKNIINTEIIFTYKTQHGQDWKKYLTRGDIILVRIPPDSTINDKQKYSPAIILENNYNSTYPIHTVTVQILTIFSNKNEEKKRQIANKQANFFWNNKIQFIECFNYKKISYGLIKSHFNQQPQRFEDDDTPMVKIKKMYNISDWSNLEPSFVLLTSDEERILNSVTLPVQLQEKNEELEQIKHYNAILENQNLVLQKKLEEKNQAIQSLIYEYNQNLQAKNPQLQRENSELQVQNLWLTGNISGLQIQNLRLHAENSELQTENSQLQIENLCLKEKNSQLEIQSQNLCLQTQNLTLQGESLYYATPTLNNFNSYEINQYQPIEQYSTSSYHTSLNL